VASTAKREELFKNSVILTFQHPLFGVGPGMFTVAEDSMARAEGKRHGAWLGTHNTFTQVSSECGIPGFLLYCAGVLAAFRKSYSLYRQTKDHPQFKEISTHALGLNYALIAFIATGMFLNAAYTSLLPILAGLTVSLLRTAAPMLLAIPAAEPALPNFARPAPYRTARPRLSDPRLV
jgi:O-antigen ligase